MAHFKSTLRKDNTTIAVPGRLVYVTPSEFPSVMGYLAATAMTAIATVIAVGIDVSVKIPNLSLIFVVPVIVAGLGFGFGASFCAALLGSLAYNFFLTEPRFSLAVDDPANIWAIGLLFVVGFIVSGVAHTSQQTKATASLLRHQTTVLQGFSRDVMLVKTPAVLVSTAFEALGALFSSPVALLKVVEGKFELLNQVGDVDLTSADFEAAQAALSMGAAMRAGIYPSETARYDFWPVKTASGRLIAIGIAFDPDNRPTNPDTFVEVVGTILALALDRRGDPIN